MFKKILFLFLLISSTIYAQHNIKGEMKPAGNFEWIALYQLQGAKQNYIVNTTIKNGIFTVNIPAKATPGMYRLVYNIEQRLFIDIIYNNENVEFIFNPNNPSQTIEFTASNENKIHNRYLNDTGRIQQKLDSLQVVYFSNDGQGDALVKQYTTYALKLKSLQQQFEKESAKKLVQHYIKAGARFNPEKPIKDPATYLNQIKSHFFDAIDFSNPVLLNSTLINNKINDFIFYLDTATDEATLTKLRKKAITTVLHKIKGNPALSKDIQEGLLYNFSQQQNVELAQFLLTAHYGKLPAHLQDLAFIKDVKGQLKTAVGMQVPDFTWTENRTEKSLYNLKSSNYYMVVFWSSTCAHCLKEVPIVYDYLKDRKDIQVLAIGLEDEKSKTGWENIINSYPKWTHIYGEHKWKNKIARAYGIHATPTYIILDKDKKVLAKPDDFNKMEQFFKEQESK